MNSQSHNRPLTDHERRLVRWMLEHGGSEALSFLPQLEVAEVTPFQCACGCASINFEIKGRSGHVAGVHPVADFLFNDNGVESGIFVFESGGVLRGLEVYGREGDAPKSLPEPDALRPFPSSE